MGTVIYRQLDEIETVSGARRDRHLMQAAGFLASRTPFEVAEES
jgi:hypothetical protein